MPSPAGPADADLIESRTFDELKVGDSARLAWLGVELDAEANARGAPLISAPSSRVCVRVIPTDEERMIAVHTRAAIAAE